MRRRPLVVLFACLAILIGMVPTSTAAPFATPPLPPKDVSANPVQGGRIQLTWKPAPGFLLTYRIYRSDKVDGTYSLVGSTSETEHLVGGGPGERAYFVVRTYKSGLLSGASNRTWASAFTATEATNFLINAQHTSSQPEEVLPSDLRKLWSTELGPTSYPLIADGKVFATGYDSYLRIFDAGTGRLVDVYTHLRHPWMAFAQHGVLVIRGSCQLTKISSYVKEVEWEHALPGHCAISAPPTASADTFYVSWWDGHQGYLLALDARSGATKWQSTVPMKGLSPAVDGSTVAVTAEDGGVYAFDLDGKLRWSKEGKGPLRTPVLADFLYARGYGGAAYSAADGTERSAFFAPNGLPMAIGERNTYLSTPAGVLGYQSGNFVWGASTPSSLPPVVAGSEERYRDSVIFAGEDGSLYLSRPPAKAVRVGKADAKVLPLEDVADPELLPSIAVAHGLVVVPTERGITVFG